MATEEELNNSREELKSAYAKLTNETDELLLSQKRLRDAEENLRRADEARNKGTQTYTDVNGKVLQTHRINLDTLKEKVASEKESLGIVTERSAVEKRLAELEKQSAELEQKSIAATIKNLQALEKSTAILEKSLGIGPVLSGITSIIGDIKQAKGVMQKLVAGLQGAADGMVRLRQAAEETQQKLGTTLGTAASQLARAQVEAVKSLATPGAKVSAAEILDATAAFKEEFGTILAPEEARKIAQESKALGTSSEVFVRARRAFLVGTSDAVKVQGTYTEAFRRAGLSRAAGLKFAAENANLVAIAGDKFAESLAIAAANAAKIGVSLDKTQRRFDSVLGDFEGFLEAAAEAQALGFKFDTTKFAEVAAFGDIQQRQQFEAQFLAENQGRGVGRDNFGRIILERLGFSVDESQRLAGLATGTKQPGQKTELEGSVDTLQDTASKSAAFTAALTSTMLSLVASVNPNTVALGINTAAINRNTAAQMGRGMGGPGGGGGGGGSPGGKKGPQPRDARGRFTARSATGELADDAARAGRFSRAGKFLGRAAAPLAVAGSLVEGVSGYQSAAAQQQAGAITKQEANEQKGRAIGGATGGLAGSIGASMLAGAAMGTFVPGAGNLVGGLVGLGAGLIGYFGGSAIGRSTGGAVGSTLPVDEQETVDDDSGISVEQMRATRPDLFEGTSYQTVDDVVSPKGYGTRALLLNNNDTVMAGTKLLSAGTLSPSISMPQQQASVNNTVNVDMSKLEAKLDRLASSLSNMKVEMDGNAVGRVSLNARSPLDRLSVV
jgi:hypothetical protein